MGALLVNEGHSPRITSIAVLHLSSDQMNSFSMHLTAEEKGIRRDDIFDKYDEIEGIMLERFFEFVSSCGDDSHWIYWNMKNINYGFEALEHRYRVLTNKHPCYIREENRFNLSAMLTSKYGYNYAGHPKLASLMDLNGPRRKQFLNGE